MTCGSRSGGPGSLRLSGDKPVPTISAGPSGYGGAETVKVRVRVNVKVVHNHTKGINFRYYNLNLPKP
jgi:hypothetical protein